MGVSAPVMSQSTTSSPSSSLVFQVGMLSHLFWISGEALLLTSLWLIWFRDNHLQLISCPPLFPNFWQFSVKTTAAHQPIIQKEVDELHFEGNN